MPKMKADGNTEERSRQLSFAWDTNTAVAVLVLGSLCLLATVGRGFRGFNVTVGAGA